jgi:hypothetical protein
MASLDKVAKVVSLPASDESGFITTTESLVDGMWHKFEGNEYCMLKPPSQSLSENI